MPGATESTTLPVWDARAKCVGMTGGRFATGSMTGRSTGGAAVRNVSTAAEGVGLGLEVGFEVGAEVGFAARTGSAGAATAGGAAAGCSTTRPPPRGCFATGTAFDTGLGAGVGVGVGVGSATGRSPSGSR